MMIIIIIIIIQETASGRGLTGVWSPLNLVFLHRHLVGTTHIQHTQIQHLANTMLNHVFIVFMDWPTPHTHTFRLQHNTGNM